MATCLYLIRHGESVWNSERRWQGRADPPLSSFGRRQAQRIAETLSEADLAAVYSSPLSRALETARLIAEPYGLNVTVLNDLMEVDVGSWQGLTAAEVKERYPAALQRWRAALDHAPDGEPLQDAGERGGKCHQTDRRITPWHGSGGGHAWGHRQTRPLAPDESRASRTIGSPAFEMPPSPR